MRNRHRGRIRSSAPAPVPESLHHLSLQLERSRRQMRSLEILMAWAAGKSLKEIQDTYDCSKTTIFRLTRAAGMPKRSHAFPTAKRDRAIALYKAGQPLSSIADSLGCSEAYVSMAAKAAGVKSRYGRRK